MLLRKSRPSPLYHVLMECAASAHSWPMNSNKNFMNLKIIG